MGVLPRSMDKKFAKGKLQKVMTYVQEIYEERDTLQTIIKMKINVQHKSGQRWAGPMA